MQKDKVSRSVIKRLPRYYRFLGLLRETGIARISSRELGERMGLTPSQIRGDLNCFGGFGQQGYGYNVEELYAKIGEILGLNRKYNAILVGAGNLGRAIATHMAFETRGFNLVGIFDKKTAVSGQIIRGLPVRHISGLDEFCRGTRIDAAMLCLPPEAAEEVARQLSELSVKSFWNFSGYDFKNHTDITVENVHLSDSLMRLCYKIKEREQR